MYGSGTYPNVPNTSLGSFRSLVALMKGDEWFALAASAAARDTYLATYCLDTAMFGSSAVFLNAVPSLSKLSGWILPVFQGMAPSPFLLLLSSSTRNPGPYPSRSCLLSFSTWSLLNSLSYLGSPPMVLVGNPGPSILHPFTSTGMGFTIFPSIFPSHLPDFSGARFSNMCGNPPWSFEKVPSSAPFLTTSVGGSDVMKGLCEKFLCDASRRCMFWVLSLSM
mmetsp:Transcript_27289/g.68789  ORF Transcript_27289/g.68789 Transcript_27289/m.68789 type:complete len:222 (+) Transcript_27289:567-1232(+)